MAGRCRREKKPASLENRVCRTNGGAFMEPSRSPEAEHRDERARDDGEWQIDIPLTPVDRSEYDCDTIPARLAKGCVLLGAAGAGAFILMCAFAGTCVGATRSSKLKWEQRQLEIEQAEHDAQSIANEKP
jgi:hypothetical protein